MKSIKLLLAAASLTGLVSGYNIDQSNLRWLSSPSRAEPNKIGDLVSKNTGPLLFGYSIAVSTTKTYYVGSPGLDGGEGAVFSCDSSTCSKMELGKKCNTVKYNGLR